MLALLAAQPEEAEVGIAAAHEALEEVEDPWGEGPELAGEALVVHEAQLVEMGLDEGAQRPLRRARPVAWGPERGCGGRGGRRWQRRARNPLGV